MIVFKALIFEGRRTAQKALDTLEDNFPTYGWIDDVAIVSRNKLGYLSVHSTWAQDDRNVEGGIGWGALTGGLLGALLGPGGALAGALGGAFTGGLVGTGINMDLNDPNLNKFANRLKKNSSALILVAEQATVEEFVTAIGVVDAEIIDTQLNYEDIKALRKELKNLS